MKFADAWALFARYGRDFMKPDAWRKGPGAHQKALGAFFGDLPLSGLTHALVDDYRRSRAGLVTAASRNREVATLVRFTRWCAKRSFVQTPLTAPEWERETPTPRAYIDVETRDRWAAQVRSPEAREVLLFAWWTGLRWGECSALTWDMIEWEGDMPMRAVLPEWVTKTAKGRLVPFPEFAQSLIVGRANGRAGGVRVFALEYHTLNYQLRTARARAGIPKDRVFHSTRHTAATNMDLSGVSFPTLKAAIGHTSDRVAMGYQHASRASLDEAAQRVSERFRKNPSIVSDGSETEI